MQYSHPPTPLGREGGPYGVVALTQREGVKFLAGINHYTSICNYHYHNEHNMIC